MTLSTSSSKVTRALCGLTLLVCLGVWAPAALGADPGNPLPASTEGSDQKVGSVLFFNLYSSSASGGATQNTRFSLTNTSASNSTAVHLFFIDGASGNPSDAFICLTPIQTASFLASDIDPGVRGFMVAVAVGLFTGCPISFNFLSGEANVKLSGGAEATLGADAYAALYAGTLAGCNAASTTALLSFDATATGYNRVPRMLAVDKLRSPADSNSVQLVLNRVGGSFLAGNSTLGGIAGVLYDDLTNSYPFTFTGSVQQFSILSDSFPLTSPVFSAAIAAGHTGWMKIYTVNDAGMVGAAFNFNPNAAVNGAAFIGGHNLRKLTLSTSNVITIPVFPPSC